MPIFKTFKNILRSPLLSLIIENKIARRQKFKYLYAIETPCCEYSNFIAFCPLDKSTIFIYETLLVCDLENRPF